MSDDPFESGAFGATKSVAMEKERRKKGFFELPEQTVDLFGLFLDPDIRKARNEVLNDIENNNVQMNGVATSFTSAAKTIAKFSVTIDAINKQAQRDRIQR